MSRPLVCLSFFLILVNAAGQNRNELNVLKDNWLEYTDASNSLYHYLAGQAFVLLNQRAERISGISTIGDWQKRQQEIKTILHEIVGPFPEKSPLNAKVVRSIDKGFYRVEHIIFESQPRFYVTSSLFLPKGINRDTRLPAIIYCSGHSVDGYRSAVYQHNILNLVKKGFIVFAFDPVGQGERLEYFEEKEGKSIIGGPTKEHSYPGAQAFLTGSSQAMYMIWDGIRSVDYLLTRKEVDPARIGITGRSGGGTQSAYIAAFDERIEAAAPENYLTNYTRLLQSIGPQDAEQNLFNMIFHGLDHADFLIVRAPRPALMITTTRDMFSIQGAMETENEVRAVYKAYGMEDYFTRVEDDAGHASTLKNREAMYAFFRKHLDNPGDTRDEEVELLSPLELQVTRTGQVSGSPGGETVFSLNKKTGEDLENRLNILRKNPAAFLPEVIKSAKLLSGYREPFVIGDPVFAGRYVRESYFIDKYFVKGEGNYVIPYLLFIPFRPSDKAVIYLHDKGKSAEAMPAEEIDRFVKEGIIVLAPDLPGYGELGQGNLQGDAYFNGVSHNLWYASMLINRSIAGIQAGDLVRLAEILKQMTKDVHIAILAKNELCSVSLHAAAFSPDIESLILVNPYSSYMSIAASRFYDPVLIPGTIPGALKRYDLPDLAAAIAPRHLLIASPTDGNKTGTDFLRIKKDLDIIKSGYMNADANENLVITEGKSIDLVLHFLRN